MNNIYQINYWLVITTILLCFTFWGGIIALPILGVSQIVMSCIIATHYKKLKKIAKNLFLSYVVTTLLFIIFFKSIETKNLEFMFLWIIISMGLACFHLYVTYKINDEKIIEKINKTIII